MSPVTSPYYQYAVAPEIKMNAGDSSGFDTVEGGNELQTGHQASQYLSSTQDLTQSFDTRKIAPTKGGGKVSRGEKFSSVKRSVTGRF